MNKILLSERVFFILFISENLVRAALFVSKSELNDSLILEFFGIKS